jgi:hypothetical protein
MKNLRYDQVCAVEGPDSVCASKILPR